MLLQVHIQHIYCKSYIYWQASNTAVHYAFISSGRGHPPDLFPLSGVPPRQTNDFFFLLLGFPDEEMVGDREGRQPGGEFENTAGSVQSKDHERCRSIFHQPLGCWRITGSEVDVGMIQTKEANKGGTFKDKFKHSGKGERSWRLEREGMTRTMKGKIDPPPT
jgi:hypothetical protein